MTTSSATRKRPTKRGEPVTAPPDSACHYDGRHWRTNACGVVRWQPGTNPKGGSWSRVSVWTLDKYPADSPLWVWLRSVGVVRPGHTQTPETQRDRPVLSVRVSRQAREALDALERRWGCSRGEALERAILGATTEAST
jgi:hypothetical protein